jgi:hypothetical protein
LFFFDYFMGQSGLGRHDQRLDDTLWFAPLSLLPRSECDNGNGSV